MCIDVYRTFTHVEVAMLRFEIQIYLYNIIILLHQFVALSRFFNVFDNISKTLYRLIN